MALRTKPVRIFESDHAPLRLLAELERRSPQEVFHAALAEYLESHRQELAAVFTETQLAIASGDLEALTEQLAASAEVQVDALVATLPSESLSSRQPATSACGDGGRRTRAHPADHAAVLDR